MLKSKDLWPLENNGDKEQFEKEIGNENDIKLFLESLLLDPFDFQYVYISLQLIKDLGINKQVH